MLLLLPLAAVFAAPEPGNMGVYAAAGVPESTECANTLVTIWGPGSMAVVSRLADRLQGKGISRFDGSWLDEPEVSAHLLVENLGKAC